MSPDGAKGATELATRIVFDDLRRPLLVLHVAASIGLVGAATHHFLRVRTWWGGVAFGLAQERRWARVTAWSYALAFGVGASLYPSYRYRVRALYLDRAAVWASRLFDLKEIYAALALVMALGLGLVPPPLNVGETSDATRRAVLRAYIAMSGFICAVVWFEVVTGVLVTSVRGLG